MAITARIGAISSVTAVAANQMPDIDKVLYLYKTYQAPLFTKLYFTQGEGKAQVVLNENAKFDWFEDQYYFYQDQLTGSGVSGGSSSEDNIGLVDGAWINEGDVLLIEKTDEMVYVDSISGGQIDITSLDGSNITAATSGYVRKLGSYTHEFATARTAVSTKEEEVSNRCTIMTETVTTTGRRQAGAKYTNGKTHKDEMKKKIEEMRQQAERMFMLSTATGTALDSSSTYRVTWSKGFYGMVTTNKYPYTTLTDANLEEYMSQVFALGSDVRDHHVGNQQLIALRQILKEKWNLDVERVSEYNVKCNRFVTDWGTLNVIRNPRMEGKFVNYGFTIDMNNAKMRYMGDDETGSRKFRVEENVHTPGTDGKSDKILMDIGFQLTKEKESGTLYKQT